jgi:hypothetical protein
LDDQARLLDAGHRPAEFHCNLENAGTSHRVSRLSAADTVRQEVIEQILCKLGGFLAQRRLLPRTTARVAT